MTRLERLQEDLEKLIEQRARLVKQGDLVKSLRYNALIEQKEIEIAECEYYEFKPLGEIISRDELAKNKVYARLLEVSLAADYLADAAVECKYILQQLGIDKMKITDDVEAIRKSANKLSALPCRSDFGELYDLMMDNDELVEKLHKTTRAYMKKKLKAKEYKV